MQQQINLYQPIARGAQGALSAAAAVRILALVGITLIGLWAFGQWQVNRLRAGVQAVRFQHEARKSLEAAGVSQLEALSQEELDAHVTALTAALDVKSRALGLLQSETQEGGATFAARLEGLARQHVEGVWLDHLTLGGTSNALSLSGTTLSPALVPQYLRSLATEPALRGAQIDEFVIEQGTSPQTSVAGIRFRASNQSLTPNSPQEQT